MTSRANALLALARGGDPSLLQVLANIAEHPHRELVTDTPLVNLEQLTEPDTERFLDLISDPRALSPAWDEPIHFRYQGFDYQFTQVYDARRRITFDTHPNRFTVHFVRRLADALIATGEAEAERTAAELNGIIARSSLTECRTLDRATADHNVLRKDPNYREILRASVVLTDLMTAEISR